MKNIKASEQIIKETQELIFEFLNEIHSGLENSYTCNPIDLDTEINIGSLEKAELITRLEKKFDVKLPETLINQVFTIGILANTVASASPSEMSRVTQPIEALEEATFNPKNCHSLIDILAHVSETEPERPHIFFKKSDTETEVITYGELFDKSKKLAKGIQRLGLYEGDTVALMLPTSIDFFIAFCGIQLAGCIPVPIYPPFRVDQIESYIQRESTILQNAEVRLLISFSQASTVNKLLKTFIPSLKAISSVEALCNDADGFIIPTISAHNAAMIQYTSGSTGNPKGVLLNHENLLANIRAYGKAIHITPEDVCVSWLPLYHDMGLIGAWMGSFYHGIPLVLMSPLSFLTQPSRWLWAIDQYKGTLSASPNFGYELCLKKITDEEIEGIDLSSWRVAANGAERVNPTTLSNFTHHFSKHGFKNTTMLPVYGLAESSVGLAIPPMNTPYIIDEIEKIAFEQEQIAKPKTTTTKETLRFVHCGIALPNHEIRVVDQQNHVLPNRHVGHLQFRGPSSMQGYYRNIEATRAIYHDGWFDTGDYAYLDNGALYITGRKKDLIIKAGRNLSPDDIEAATASVENIRKGCVIAFSLLLKQEEQLIVIAETHELDVQKKQQLQLSINQAIVAHVGVMADDVVLVPPGTIPKTSSGKLQRSHCKMLYSNGHLVKNKKRVKLQLVRLGLQSIKKLFINATCKAFYFVYTIYCLAITLIHSPFILFTLMLTNKITSARACCRLWAKWLFICFLCPIQVKGAEKISKNKTYIFAANHASYIDFILLIAALPNNISFVGKHELWRSKLLKPLLKKLNYIPIDRFNYEKADDTVNIIHDYINDHRTSIALFPEGTFTFTSGLKKFRLGAFKVATMANVPVCPVSLSGTRKFLRAGSWILTPTRLTVTINDPIEPIGNNWTSINTLMIKTRNAILAHCNEEAL